MTEDDMKRTMGDKLTADDVSAIQDNAKATEVRTFVEHKETTEERRARKDEESRALLEEAHEETREFLEFLLNFKDRAYKDGSLWKDAEAKIVLARAIHEAALEEIQCRRVKLGRGISI